MMPASGNHADALRLSGKAEAIWQGSQTVDQEYNEGSSTELAVGDPAQRAPGL